MTQTPKRNFTPGETVSFSMSVDVATQDPTATDINETTTFDISDAGGETKRTENACPIHSDGKDSCDKNGCLVHQRKRRRDQNDQTIESAKEKRVEKSKTKDDDELANDEGDEEGEGDVKDKDDDDDDDDGQKNENEDENEAEGNEKGEDETIDTKTREINEAKAGVSTDDSDEVVDPCVDPADKNPRFDKNGRYIPRIPLEEYNRKLKEMNTANFCWDFDSEYYDLNVDPEDQDPRFTHRDRVYIPTRTEWTRVLNLRAKRAKEFAAKKEQEEQSEE